jgi:hypothetical protein
MQKKEFPITCCMCATYSCRKAKYIHKSKPIFSSEWMLHKDSDRKGSAQQEKFSVHGSQGA